MRRMYSKKQLEEMIANGKVALEVANVKQLNDKQCELLKAGDLVEKVDNTGKHTYIVTFKKDKVGLCLTYFDASCIETQSYDFTASHWVYNSEDKGEFKSDADIKALAKEEIESASAGTPVNVIGLDSNGNMIKGSVSGGTKLYRHNIKYGSSTYLELVNTKAEAYTSAPSYVDVMSSLSFVYSSGGVKQLVAGIEWNGTQYTITKVNSGTSFNTANLLHSNFTSDSVTEL